MEIKHRGRVALVTALAFAASGGLAYGATSTVTVRVEGPNSTLVLPTTVKLRGGKVVKDGNPAHACSGMSAAGALQAATHGRWGGTWSSTFAGYFVTTIDGVTFPQSGARFWSFWIDNAVASAGVCGITPKNGDSLLFFPDCFGPGCPPVAPVILAIKAPRVVLVGRRFAVRVSAYPDAGGAAKPQAAAKINAGGVKTTTNAAGRAELSVGRVGRVVVRASAANAIRSEAIVCVHIRGDGRCRTPHK
jgi:hypothetical protein